MATIISFVGGAAVGAYFGSQVRTVFAWAINKVKGWMA